MYVNPINENEKAVVINSVTHRAEAGDDVNHTTKYGQESGKMIDIMEKQTTHRMRREYRICSTYCPSCEPQLLVQSCSRILVPYL